MKAESGMELINPKTRERMMKKCKHILREDYLQNLCARAKLE